MSRPQNNTWVREAPSRFTLTSMVIIIVSINTSICITLALLQILENIAENIEEIEEEFLVFRDLSSHPNIPEFFGLFLKRGASPDDDQIWFVMEVCRCAVDFIGRIYFERHRVDLSYFAALHRRVCDGFMCGNAGPRQ